MPKLAKELRVPTPANRGPGQPWRPGKSVPAAVDPSLPSADIRIGYARCSHRTLAELATETEIAQTFTDRCVGELVTGRLTDTEAAMAKWSVTERQQQLVCRCLQLHGGYGYMTEYPIAKDFLDTRASTLFADTTEIIGKSLVR
ncbi:acyl-CoA dehydrogenase family protein [Streptomyces sp. NPDC007851]|uniref:acyl-CoA dehydrogenase family protein n=1 Tax=Streptomyces sp. NPDC007851 TaxID=3155008 RepID=UPI0033F06A7F